LSENEFLRQNSDLKHDLVSLFKLNDVNDAKQCKIFKYNDVNVNDAKQCKKDNEFLPSNQSAMLNTNVFDIQMELCMTLRVKAVIVRFHVPFSLIPRSPPLKNNFILKWTCF
jgi:hypothetical protein